MATTARRKASIPVADTLTLGDRTQLLHHIILMRKIEERGLKLYKQGKIPGSFYDGRGQEAISVGAAFALDAADSVCSPLIRDLGAHLVRGTALADIFRHYMGRSNDLSHGREGNVHFGDRRRGVVGMVSMLPDMVLVANGLALSYQMRGEARVALTFFGDGATSRGDWHEAMNWAGLDSLPVIFVMENNQWAYSTPTTRQFAVNPVERAAGYGVAAQTIDGNDVEQVFQAVLDARTRALLGKGPTLIEAQTMRMHGHGAHDDSRYIDPSVLAEWASRDPVQAYDERCRQLKIDVSAIHARVDADVEAAVQEALATPMPHASEALSDVFCVGEPEPLGHGLARWSGFLSDGEAA
jgi:TPP-dependent pyruvate/acetoin dehydrogenase alpha subunit